MISVTDIYDLSRIERCPKIRKKKKRATREKNKTQSQLGIFTGVTCEGGVYVHFIRLPKQAPLLSGKRRMFVEKIRS